MDTVSKTSNRIVSLDVLRGITVIAMLLVDQPGTWETRFSIFNHANWNGITVADFIFPFFLFIMGVSMAISQRKYSIIGSSSKVALKVTKRCIALFMLGYIINYLYSSPGTPFSEVRLLGVLQRIAIVYLFSSIALYNLYSRHTALACGAILLVYWGIMTLIPIPDYGKPNLNLLPGEAIPNLSAYIDYKLLGLKAFQWTRPYDPEGILSTLPAIASTLTGIIYGRWLTDRGIKGENIFQPLTIAGILIAIGVVWSYFFPINKNIWTSSFVLVTSGVALWALNFTYWLIDRKGIWKKYAIAQCYGSNALTAFVLFGVFDATISRISIQDSSIKDLIFSSLFSSWLPTIHASWVYSVVLIGVFTLLFRFLFLKRIFIRL